MNKKFIGIFTLLFSFSLTSCVKDKNHNLIGKYHTQSIISITNPVMYTNNGAVVDELVIKDFLKRKNVPYFIFDSVFETSTSLINLNIHDNNKINIYGVVDTIYAEITNVTNNLLIIEQIDSIGALANNSNDRCVTLKDSIIKVQPHKTNYLVPIGIYIGYFSKYRRPFPIEQNNGQLSIPFLTWVTSNKNGCLSAVQNAWNIFNNNIVGELISGDTIVVQSKRQILIKE